MGQVCELCQGLNAEEKVEGVYLCKNCAVGVRKMFQDNMDAIRTYANEANYPKASLKATKNIVDYAKKRLNAKTSDSPYAILGYRQPEKKVEQRNVQQTNSTVQVNTNTEKKRYQMKYHKVLSTNDKREWIERYITIKRFVAGVYAVIGLVIGFLVARILDSGTMTYVICVLIGGGIASALGTNAVGTAMMEAITAEQNIVTEELLTEILDKVTKE